jgi:hypothetical protein
VGARRHHHAADRPTGTQRFEDGVPAVEQISGRAGASRRAATIVAVVRSGPEAGAPAGRRAVSVAAERRASVEVSTLAPVTVATISEATLAVVAVAVSPGRPAIVAPRTAAWPWTWAAEATRPRCPHAAAERDRRPIARLIPAATLGALRALALLPAIVAVASGTKAAGLVIPRHARHEAAGHAGARAAVSPRGVPVVTRTPARRPGVLEAATTRRPAPILRGAA